MCNIQSEGWSTRLKLSLTHSMHEKNMNFLPNYVALPASSLELDLVLALSDWSTPTSRREPQTTWDTSQHTKQNCEDAEMYHFTQKTSQLVKRENWDWSNLFFTFSKLIFRLSVLLIVKKTGSDDILSSMIIKACYCIFISNSCEHVEYWGGRPGARQPVSHCRC